MRRARVPVNIQSVRFGIYKISFRAQSFENAFCDIPAASVSAVKSDFKSPERKNSKRYKMTYITVSARNVVDRPADIFTRGERQSFVAVEKFFNFFKDAVLHLLALRIY